MRLFLESLQLIFYYDLFILNTLLGRARTVLSVINHRTEVSPIYSWPKLGQSCGDIIYTSWGHWRPKPLITVISLKNYA